VLRLFGPVNLIRIKSPLVIDEVEIDGIVLREADRAIETGTASGVAGSGTLLGHVKNQGILIAVGSDFVDLLGVARSGSFVPNFLPGSGIINGFTLLDRHLQGVGIHVGEHEGFPGFVVNRHRGNEAVGIKFGAEGKGLIEILFVGSWGELKLTHGA